jgi:putative SOS response-associated peptidase YedK
MCFNVSVKKKKKVLENRFKAVFSKDAVYTPAPFLSAFTHPNLPIITQENPKEIQMYNWGLIPSWIRDFDQAEQLRKKTLNARIETAFEKPSFDESIKNQHCLILADGFFEWQDQNKEKIPHFIYRKDEESFAFAGIYNSWEETGTGIIYNTCTILTQQANPFMAEIHNTKKRQPIILPPELEKEWLTQDCDAIELTNSCKGIKLQAHTIAKDFRSLSGDDVTKCVDHQNWSLF